MESSMLLRLLWVAGLVLVGAIALALALLLQWWRAHGIAPGSPRTGEVPPALGSVRTRRSGRDVRAGTAA